MKQHPTLSAISPLKTSLVHSVTTSLALSLGQALECVFESLKAIRGTERSRGLARGTTVGDTLHFLHSRSRSRETYTLFSTAACFADAARARHLYSRPGHVMPPVGNKSRGGKARSDGRSRNTTPISTTSNDQASATSDPSSLSYLELLKEYGSLSSPPPVGQLKKIMESLRTFSDVAKIRSDTCDKGMRELSKQRRELGESIRQRELADRQAEEDRKQKELRKGKVKKEQEEAEEEKRPLTTGAHALAPQDGSAPDGMFILLLFRVHRHFVYFSHYSQTLYYGAT